MLRATTSRLLRKNRALPKLPERHPNICLNNGGTVIGIYHPSTEFDVKFENTFPLPIEEACDTTNEGRLKLELLSRGEGLDNSTPIESGWNVRFVFFNNLL